MVEDKTGFLRNIQDTSLYWTFTLVGRKVVTGRVIHFLWTEQAIPITLMIQEDKKDTPVEIPWGIIQTITQSKG